MKSIKNYLFCFLIQFVFVRSAPLNSDVLNKTTPEMIADEGYPVETHWLTTPDGYNLCLHRIPTGKNTLFNSPANKKIVFLQHGILSSSSDWILFGPGLSLGYILADEGYDVWMGNARGNVYSRNHTHYNPDKDGKFWQFSWNEIGEIDLPAMIDYVLNYTSSDKLYYAGHSQGTTSFFVMCSQKPEYNDKIKVHVSLAPVAYMKHMSSPLLKFIAKFDGPLEAMAQLLGINELLPASGFLHSIMEQICSDGLGPVLCQNVLFVLCGFGPNEMNITRVPLIMHHTPAGASTKQLLHYAQEINSGYFRKYDYGLTENLEKYGSMNPPNYDLYKVTAPVHLFYSKNDMLAAIVDVEKLCDELGNCAGKVLITDNLFGHLDFTYGINAPKLVYRNLLSVFESYK